MLKYRTRSVRMLLNGKQFTNLLNMHENYLLLAPQPEPLNNTPGGVFAAALHQP